MPTSRSRSLRADTVDRYFIWSARSRSCLPYHTTYMHASFFRWSGNNFREKERKMGTKWQSRRATVGVALDCSIVRTFLNHCTDGPPQPLYQPLYQPWQPRGYDTVRTQCTRATAVIIPIVNTRTRNAGTKLFATLSTFRVECYIYVCICIRDLQLGRPSRIHVRTAFIMTMWVRYALVRPWRLYGYHSVPRHKEPFRVMLGKVYLHPGTSLTS